MDFMADGCVFGLFWWVFFLVFCCCFGVGVVGFLCVLFCKIPVNICVYIHASVNVGGLDLF